LLQFSHITLILDSMPKPFAFFRPVCLKASPNDQRYSDRMESLFQLDTFRSKLTRILPTLISVLEKESFRVDISKSRLDELARFSVLSMDFAKWVFSNAGSDDLLKGFEHVVGLALRATTASLSCQPVLAKLVRFKTGLREALDCKGCFRTYDRVWADIFSCSFGPTKLYF